MIQPKYVTLTGLFADRVFRIPSYQRFYSWQTKQRNDLFGDILTLAEVAGDGHHFMATIVCHDTGQKASVGSTEYHVFEVVDGQQRITTLIMILRAIARELEEGDNKKEVEELLVKRDGHLLLLQTNNANQALFNDYLRTGTIPSATDVKTHADRNLQTGITQCEQFVEKWIADGKDLLYLLLLVKNRLGFVVYDTDDKRSVYTVFEVLNSRGLEVDWLDKSKTVLMGRAFETAPTEPAQAAAIQELEAKWGNIYQRLALRPVPGQEVLRVTASTRLDIDAGKPLSAELSLSQFKEMSDSPAKAQEVTNWLYRTTDGLVGLEEKRHLGPVINILQARVLAVAIMLAEQITPDQKEICLDQWERVTFRIYGLLRNDARTKVGDYMRLARKILRAEQGAKTADQVLAELKHLGVEYPINSAVNSGLANTNCYEGFEAECRYLLWRYEEHLAAEAGSEVNKELREAIWNARSAAETIEHVFPQHPSADWNGKLDAGAVLEEQVHRIGNLLLLPQRLNSEATRNAFAVKKGSFRKSEGLRMVKEVIKKKDWRQVEIEEREKRILKWAKTAWADLP